MTMNKEDYKAIRQIMLIKQDDLANLLGVTRETISRRESGKLEISKEAALAAMQLFSQKKGTNKLPSKMTVTERMEARNS